MAFTNSSTLILNDSDVTHDYQTSQSSPLSVNIPSGASGTWEYVVSRAGYEQINGEFNPSGGGTFNFPISQTQRLQPNGDPMYTGTTSSLVAVSFDVSDPGDPFCYIDIGDGQADAQAVIDEIEDALETEDGCKFLAFTDGSQVTFANLSAGTFLFMGTKYRLRALAGGQANTAVGAFVISTDGTPVDGSNGSVAFLSANNTDWTDEEREQIRDAMGVDGTKTTSVGGVLQDTYKEAKLAKSLSA